MIDTTKNETPVKVLNLPVAGPFSSQYRQHPVCMYTVEGPGTYHAFDESVDASVHAARLNNAYILGFATALLANANVSH